MKGSSLSSTTQLPHSTDSTLQSLIKRTVITISGPAGSGKSHCACALAEIFGMQCHSAGSIFRQIARERGLTIEELTAKAETDPQIDQEIDQRSEMLALGGGIVLEGRLVTFFASKAENKLSFYLTAPFDERAKRIAEREGISLDEARGRTEAREESEKRRYRSLYDLDIMDLSIYDFVVNTAVWDKESEIEVLKKIIETFFELRLKQLQEYINKQ